MSDSPFTGRAPSLREAALRSSWFPWPAASRGALRALRSRPASQVMPSQTGHPHNRSMCPVRPGHPGCAHSVVPSGHPLLLHQVSLPMLNALSRERLRSVLPVCPDRPSGVALTSAHPLSACKPGPSFSNHLHSGRSCQLSFLVVVTLCYTRFVGFLTVLAFSRRFHSFPPCA